MNYLSAYFVCLTNRVSSYRSSKVLWLYDMCSLLLSNNMRPQDGENLYHTSTSASISIYFYMILTWTTYATHLPKITMTIEWLFMSCIIESQKFHTDFLRRNCLVSVTQNSILYNAMYSDVAQRSLFLPSKSISLHRTRPWK